MPQPPSLPTLYLAPPPPRPRRPQIDTFMAKPLQPECDTWCWFPVADRANAMQQWLDAAEKNTSLIKVLAGQGRPSGGGRGGIWGGEGGGRSRISSILALGQTVLQRPGKGQATLRHM